MTEYMKMSQAEMRRHLAAEVATLHERNAALEKALREAAPMLSDFAAYIHDATPMDAAELYAMADRARALLAKSEG